jgi:hypothetical protein
MRPLPCRRLLRSGHASYNDERDVAAAAGERAAVGTSGHPYYDTGPGGEARLKAFKQWAAANDRNGTGP